MSIFQYSKYCFPQNIFIGLIIAWLGQFTVEPGSVENFHHDNNLHTHCDLPSTTDSHHYCSQASSKSRKYFVVHLDSVVSSLLYWVSNVNHRESVNRGVRTLNGNCICLSKAPSMELWMPELVLYGIRLLAQASLGKLSTNERRALTFLDQ